MHSAPAPEKSSADFFIPQRKELYGLAPTINVSLRTPACCGGVEMLIRMRYAHLSAKALQEAANAGSVNFPRAKLKAA